MRAPTLKQLLWTLAALAGAAALAAAGVIAAGLYDVAASAPHWQPVHTLLETTMRQSVRRRARDVVVPPPGGAEALDRGAACYRAHCVVCHGGPGEAPAPFARSLQPLPGPLVDAAARWRRAELYWITRHGIRMSGMPAWEHRLAEADQWAVVAFVAQLGGLGTEDYRRWMARLPPDDCSPSTPAPAAADGGDAERGRRLLPQYGCQGCHRIPGVTGSPVNVGPPLAGFGARALVAGRLPNTPEQVAAWLRDPAAVDPQTAMPQLGVGARDAQDMAAYLATLR